MRLPSAARPQALDKIRLLDYLYGYDTGSIPPDPRLSQFGRRIPKLTSPISHYIQEVWGFISEFAPRIDLVSPTPAKQRFLTRFLEKGIGESGVTLWERLAIAGEILLVLFPEKWGYSLRVFETPEFREVDGGFEIRASSPEGVYAVDLNSERYRVYDSSGNPSRYTDYPHQYGEVPAIRVANNRDQFGNGYSDFDETSIDLAIELIRQTAIPATNYSYFGRPFFVSPNPADTLKRINDLNPVFQREAPEDGGTVEVLSFPPVPDSHREYLSHLKREFAEQLGISYLREDSRLPDSGAALRIHFSSTLRVASAKMRVLWRGLVSLCELALRCAAWDGILLDVIVGNPESWGCTWEATGSPFPVSPQERLIQAQLVNTLIGLGVDRISALREIYSDLSPEEIARILESGNLNIPG